jgi:glutamate N-acetyltransferase/amino-acid N-acetyltransferase
LAAGLIGASAEEVLVASTGVIGQLLPMNRVREGIQKVAFTLDGGNDLARAIMTTDTVPKAAAVKMEGVDFTIGGICKGSGMIHPSLATFLCFLTTDAAVDKDFLKLALKQAADISFNMVSIDGDTSTNDTVLLLANGLAGNEPITKKSRLAEAFQLGLNHLCIHLAKLIARDGEGATRRIEVTVNGAPNVFAARLAARTIVSSSLVKSAVHGADPNWGRVLAALGRTGVEIDEKKIDLYFGNVCMLKDGRPVPFDHDEAVRVLIKDEVPISVNLNLGIGAATAWGCDLSEEYVTINSAYTT